MRYWRGRATKVFFLDRRAVYLRLTVLKELEQVRHLLKLRSLLGTSDNYIGAAFPEWLLEPILRKNQNLTVLRPTLEFTQGVTSVTHKYLGISNG